MSKLDDIQRNLVKRTIHLYGKRNAAKEMALATKQSKQEVKDLMLELIEIDTPFAHLWHAAEENKANPADGYGAYNEAKWGAIKKAQDELRQKVSEL
jgi:hypothetical protein